jgi:hypothetical protein
MHVYSRTFAGSKPMYGKKEYLGEAREKSEEGRTHRLERKGRTQDFFF